jgi:Ser-tRNA(Ala) deacylase AlaX
MEMTAAGSNREQTVFTVNSVRHGDSGRILHYGQFAAGTTPFAAGMEVVQTIDSAKRNLHSRIHTAGHLLGLAVRHLANEVVQGGAQAFSEQKASHYPGDSRVEFGGLIAGEHKDAIQRLANDYVRRGLPVKICFCMEMAEVKRRCGEDATKEMKMTAEMRDNGGMRVVEVEGLGGYPCGGTHLPLTSDVGGIVVTGIKRRQGVSKVSYGVLDAPPA